MSKSFNRADCWLYVMLGIPLGFLIAMKLPAVFYTTKPGHSIAVTWFIGAPILVATTLGVSSWIVKSRMLSLRQIFCAVLVGLFASFFVGFVVSNWFARAHHNYFESVEKYGDFFRWMTFFLYSILLSGLISFIGVLLYGSQVSHKSLVEHDH